MMAIGLGTKRIGITIDPSGVRYVQLRKKKAWEIEKSAFLPLPEGVIVEDQILNPDSVRTALKQWVKEQKLTGATASIAVPTSQIIVRKMQIPSKNVKELRHLVELEVETTLHLPFEDPVHDFIRIGETEEGTQVLIFAAPRKWIVACADLLHDAGIRVKTAELGAMSLIRSLFAQQNEQVSETMIINIEDNTLDIYMFHEGYPLFMRSINLNESANHDPGRLNEYQIGEITAEISRMLSFYQFGLHEGASRITRTIVAGAHQARVDMVAALRETQPEIAINEATFEAYEPGFGPTDKSEAYLIAAGLAIPVDKLKVVNLLPRIDREARVYPYVLVGTVAIWLLGMVLTGGLYVYNKSTQSDNEQRVQALNDQFALLQNELGNSGSTSQSDPVAVIKGIKQTQKDVAAMFHEMEKRLPTGAILNTAGYTDQGQISIGVSFNTMNDASRYLFDLRRLSFASWATMPSINENETTAQVQNNNTITVTKPFSASYVITVKQAEEGGAADGTVN